MTVNRMEWIYLYETGWLTVGEIIGNEQDIFEWIVETEEHSESYLTRDDIQLEGYRYDDSTYVYYLPFGIGSQDVEVTFKKNEDGLYVVNEIVVCYDEETETESDYPRYDNPMNDFQFKILSNK